MLKGDKILAINGEAVSEWYDLTDIVRKNPETTLLFTIQRGDQIIELPIKPKKEEGENDKGELISVGKVGISPYFHYEWRDLSFGQSIVKGFNQVIFFLSMNVKGFAMIFTGEISAKESLGGPIMIGKMVVNTAKIGFIPLLEMTALLSAILALINILPIPALDGGHLLIILIEAVRKKPLSLNIKIKIQQVGMAILLVLMVFVIYNDLAR